MIICIVPAQVSAPMTSVVVAEGLSALLRCQVRGDRPVEVVWRKNSIPIEHNPRVVLQTILDTNSSTSGGGGEEFSAELKILGCEKSDSSIYQCSAFNQYGRDQDTISLHVKGSSPIFLYILLFYYQ
jgi:hypothetical protein